MVQESSGAVSQISPAPSLSVSVWLRSQAVRQSVSWVQVVLEFVQVPREGPLGMDGQLSRVSGIPSWSASRRGEVGAILQQT